jgi:hypothetical protein
MCYHYKDLLSISKLQRLLTLFGAEIRKVVIDYEPGTADKEITMASGNILQSVDRVPLEARDVRKN